MNCFLITLILILLVGIAITQLAFIQWTEGWLWSVLHLGLLLVSISTKACSYLTDIYTPLQHTINSLLNLSFVQLSMLACYLILQKAVRWAVFPYNSSFIAVSHHRDLNM